MLLYKNWIQTEELVDSELNENVEKEIHSEIIVDSVPINSQNLWYAKRNDISDNDVNGLEEAKEKIRQLEAKLLLLDARIPKAFPDVKYLSYRAKKRILVRNFIF